MTFDEISQAMKEAKATIARADTVADQLATMLDGRLRVVSTRTLEKLKRELRDFNIQTHRWKAR